ncbi:MAG: peptidase S8 [Candidatus Eremiobacteraeota bacterium]|nr:peptidase S8 [Candidatus Eremiobacteraeota bacterium]
MLRAAALLAAFALSACAGAGVGNPPASSALKGSLRAGYYPLVAPGAVRRLCPQPARPDEMECYALERVDLRQGEVRPGVLPLGYSPSDLRSAYAIADSGGNGVTVAIVDAYAYPTAAHDLATYRAAFKLPPCDASNHCLRIVGQHGGAPPKKANANWDGEQALDLDMVSAVCPNCRILLVESKDGLNRNLYAGVATAHRLGAVTISNSYGGRETQPSNPIFAGPGSTYVAGAGDDGGGLSDHGGPAQPCTLPNVVCVGGTELIPAGLNGVRRSKSARSWSEVTWNDETLDLCNGPCGATGSACSKLVAKPSWQTDNGCTARSAADLAIDASVLTPVAIYCRCAGGWTAAGGTSVGSPVIAAMIALAGNGDTTNVPAKIWSAQGSSAFNDVTQGTNVYKPVTGPCASSIAYICVAGAGYDGPTGWGSPNGLSAL